MNSLLSEAVPRYTSYPPIPYWDERGPDFAAQCLSDSDLRDKPLSVYVHIPFCSQRCHFCGCVALASQNSKLRHYYLEALRREIELKAYYLGRFKATHLHFGGGTPTILSKEEITCLMKTLWQFFDWDPLSEVAIEIDPRTIDSKKYLTHLSSLRFNRISLGVQDLDEQVQSLIGRHQTRKQTFAVYDWCRKVGFEEINFDLIYGLPGQTLVSFESTITKVIEMAPDRISLFSFACIPQKNSNQKGILLETLPTPAEKLKLFMQAQEQLILAGYVAIGMDHFAKSNDKLALAHERKILRRNFQGYYQGTYQNLIGYGLSAISNTSSNYFQNTKNLKAYFDQIYQNVLPVAKGKKLSSEDEIRGWVIEQILCFFEVNKAVFFQKFGLDFDLCFKKEIALLQSRFSEDKLDNHDSLLSLKGDLRFFSRNIAAYFDSYFMEKNT